MDLVSFWALQPSANSFLVKVSFAGDTGHLVATRGKTRLSMAAVETSLGAGLLEPVESP